MRDCLYSIPLIYFIWIVKEAKVPLWFGTGVHVKYFALSPHNPHCTVQYQADAGPLANVETSSQNQILAVCSEGTWCAGSYPIVFFLAVEQSAEAMTHHLQHFLKNQLSGKQLKITYCMPF